MAWFQSPNSCRERLLSRRGDDQLSDERWSELMDEVRNEFGRPLAVAVGRGRIIAAEATTIERG